MMRGHYGCGVLLLALSNIAAEIYNDPTQWRVIAEANNLDDPRHLEVGARLAIPKLG